MGIAFKKYTQACTSTRKWPDFRTIVNIGIRLPSQCLTLAGKMRTVAIEGAKRLGNIKSIKNVIPKTGDNIWVDEQSTIKQKIQDIIKKKVSSGMW